jgi:hypothetical protein
VEDASDEEMGLIETSFAEEVGDIDYSPSSVVAALKSLAPREFLLIIDEFDRIGEDFDRKLFVDVLKYIWV